MTRASRAPFASLAAAFTLVLLAVAPTPAYAHKPSDAFLNLDIEGTTLSGQLDVAVRDLEIVLGIDADGDRRITWGELRRREPELRRYLEQHVHLVSDTGPCAITPLDLQVSDYTDGAYASLIFDTSCRDHPIAKLEVTYDGLFDLDAQHRCLLGLSWREERRTGVLTAESHTWHFDATEGGPRHLLATFIQEGMHHIFAGFDHILFLVALLLPAVFVTAGRRPVPRESLRSALVDTAKVVTGFTAAHTVSLCLTSFQLVTPPPTRVVECAVAATVLLTAINNLFPIIRERRWLMGFGFGLVHGIGYASVLTDLGLSGWTLAWPLVGFNVGVELAQLVVIVFFLPVAYLLRRTLFYRNVMLWGGSLVTAGLAVVWMVEQIARVSILSF